MNTYKLKNRSGFTFYIQAQSFGEAEQIYESDNLSDNLKSIKLIEKNSLTKKI